MEAIRQLIIENIIQILGVTYTVNKIGRHSVSVSGKRGARFTIIDFPKMGVREDKSVPVFALMAKGGSLKYFGIDGNSTVRLYA